MKKILLIALFLLPISRIQAADFLISPAVIDVEMDIREELSRTIILENKEERDLWVYGTVFELDAEKGLLPQNPSASTKNAPANWIDVSRALQIIPSLSKKELTLKIKTPPGAISGNYHTAIIFADSSMGRDEAEAKMATEGKRILLNISIRDNSREAAGLLGFKINRKIITQDKIIFSYKTKNTGNVPTSPIGDISVTNRRGAEVVTINANPEDKKLAEGELWETTQTLKGKLPMGKYKAVLNISYGDRSSQLQDSLEFWVVPMWLSILVLAVIAITPFLYWKALMHKPPIRKRRIQDGPVIVDLRHPEQ